MAIRNVLSASILTDPIGSICKATFRPIAFPFSICPFLGARRIRMQRAL
jgi:hypothetical protein